MCRGADYAARITFSVIPTHSVAREAGAIVINRLPNAEGGWGQPPLPKYG